MKQRLLLAFFSVIFLRINGQGSILPLGNEAYRLLERFEIRSAIQRNFHSSIKTFDRRSVVAFIQEIDSIPTFSSHKYRQDLKYVYLDNNEWLVRSAYPKTLAEKNSRFRGNSSIRSHAIASVDHPAHQKNLRPLFQQFYHTPANFWEVQSPGLYLKINPLAAFRNGTLTGEETRYSLIQRGFELRGGIDDRLYFYFNLLRSNGQYPEYVDQFTLTNRSLPGQGSFDFTDDGYSYWNGQGHIGFNFSRSSGVEIGRGRNFIGDGYRSLFLSDFSNNYFYVKINWRVWKFHLQNIFTELSPGAKFPGQSQVTSTKKYMAAHYLSYNHNKNLNISIFETVVFNREQHFEFQYLNPVILYRTVEQALGSPDNVFLGASVKWNFLRHFQLYGQVIFDEIKINELTSGNGWWANKYGTQIGLKYIDAFGVDHLDLQIERNTVRPYTYSHNDSLSAYTHYNQPLAHPIGANFKETIILATYCPIPKLTLRARLLLTDLGEDEEGVNWGHSLLNPNGTHELEYGNVTGQGIGATVMLAGVDLSYQVAHNVFLDFYYLYRDKDSELDARDLNTRLFGAGLRVNLHRQRLDF